MSSSGIHLRNRWCPVCGAAIGPSAAIIPLHPRRTPRGRLVHVCGWSCARRAQEEPDEYLELALAEVDEEATTSSHR